MRRGGRILVILGLLLGLATAAVIFLTLANNQPVTQSVATRPVVVAQQNIPQRGTITSDMITVIQWPVDAIPAGGVYETPGEVNGKIALNPIFQGQLIVPQMVTSKSPSVISPTGSIASFVVPDGMVAMAFSVSDLNGVAGAIQPGDTVDFLLTLQATQLPSTQRAGTTTAATTGTEGLPVTQIMLQNVLVLNVGSWSAPVDKNTPTGGLLTLVLTRQDALALKSAMEQGEITLVLRRVGDKSTADLEPVNLQYLNKRFKFNLVPGNTGR